MSSESLFDFDRKVQAKLDAPLAERMRPQTFEDFVGQDQIVDPNKVLLKSIGAGRLPSMILWGPPGTGKTTLARLVATSTQSDFQPLSAVTSGVADLRKIVAEAKDRKGMHRRSTILFVDEIHRFNKAQQDVILPHVEDGTIIFIGATTENPSFEIIAPLLSRCRVFTLQSLNPDQMKKIIARALTDGDVGLGPMHATMADDAADYLVNISNGDARIALNAMETAAYTSTPDAYGNRIINLETISDALQRRSPIYDKAGESHYDTISAFIKSVRGSSPDGALYWLARMIESGEDPMFISRRLVILASEDIGLADPQALGIAIAAQQAVHFLGMPEGRIPMAEAAVYLASAPKSNTAYAALNQAIQDVREQTNEPVPLHLRNAVTEMMNNMGYGKGYKYSHDFEGHFDEQEYLPPSLKGRRYYFPGEEGEERQIGERLKEWWGGEAADYQIS